MRGHRFYSAREGRKKNAKKGRKNVKNIFLFTTNIKVSHTFLHHFSRAFQNYSFQICNFSHKKVMGYLRFFLQTPVFYRPAPYLRHKKLPKNALNFYLWKLKKLEWGVKCPPPACLGLGAPGRHRCFIFVGNPA